MTAPDALFANDTLPLVPGDAAAAIILDPNDKVLLQLRDTKPGIFYPAHWGFFGGALEAEDSSPAEGLRRELQEELNLDIPLSALAEFTTYTFDFCDMGRGVLSRKIFTAHFTAEQIPTIRLGEGSAFKWFTLSDALTSLRLVPYDAFALWMWQARARLRAQEINNG